MKHSLATGFIGGCLGAIVLVIIMYIMKAAGMGDPGFVGTYRATIGSNPPADQIIAALLFIISGGIWGLIFTWLIKKPTVLKAILFGFLPTLWLWVAVNAFMGKPLFNGFELKGIIVPLIFNMLIWGSILGWYVSGKIRKKVAL
ncbi:MAG: hypothetical protein ABIR50_09070 [Ginsengibacter sp.]